MRFQIPQYIDIEDRIIGPLTLKQFLFLFFPGLIIYLLWASKLIPKFAVILIGLIIIPWGLASAFLKINGQKFNHVFANFLTRLVRPRFYLWKKIPRAKFFPEVDISLFHKKKSKEEITEEEKLLRKIEEVAFMVDVGNRKYE